jgi:hypothetical protein
VRGSLVYDTVPELLKGVQRFYADVKESKSFTWSRIKNRLDPTDVRQKSGYRDVLVNIEHESGIIVEIQFHINAWYNVKNRGGHEAYRKFRVIKEEMMQLVQSLTCRRQVERLRSEIMEPLQFSASNKIENVTICCCRHCVDVW